MGIQNKDGALYFATGIDNTGLYSGRREAMGIIKAMAGEITSFDVFGGIGISAGIAFAQAAKGAYEFEKQFQQSMKEVATLSNGIKGSLTDYMNQVVELTREIPVMANDAAKALYQIVSAGHDGADGMKVLEVSAKAAIGGVTDTATAADGITTLLNAYKLDVSAAEKISDQLFTTVKLGKTSFGELGKSIAQVAPIAASYGVETDQVLAAVATLTKQGTPTAQAMTQIRASIIAVSKVLGDGAFDTRTYQEALAEVSRQAGGSEAKLRELVPEVEAVNAVLGLTGINVKEAAGHLGEMQNASGAAEAAFKEMASSAENQMKLLGNNITAALRPLGESILKEISTAAQSMNEAFKDGSAEEALKNIGALIVVVTTALAGYKGSILAVSTAKQVWATVTAIVNRQRAIEAADLVLKKGLYAIEATMIAKNTSARILLTGAIKAQTIAQLKNVAAMLTNPYVLAAAAFAGLGYAIYRCATAESDSERAMRKHNTTMETQKKNLDDLKSKAEGFLTVIRDETSSQSEKLEAYKQLQTIMPNVLKNLDLEKLKTMELTDAKRLLNEEAYKQYVMGIKVKAVLKQEELDTATAEWQKAVDEAKKNKKDGVEDPGVSIKIGRLAKKKNEAEESVRLAKEEVDKINEIQKKAKEEQNKEDEKAAIQNKAFWTKQKDDATKALDSIASTQKKQMDAGNFKGIDSTVVKSYKDNAKKLKEAEKELKVYDSSSKQSKSSDTLRKDHEKYKILMDQQKREQERMKTDSLHELEQIEINGLEEGSEKVLRQRKLNHDKEIEAIKREAEDKKLKAIEEARSAFEANPANAKKTFDTDKFVQSEPTKNLFASFDKTVEAKTKTENTKYNRGDDLKGLLDEYQDYTDKRLAIETKYDNDLATLEEQRKQAVKNGDTKQIEQIDRAKAQATANKGKELMSLDYEKLKESPEYVRAFENLKETSSETLNSLLTQLENAKNTAAQVLSPDQLREYTTTIQEIMDELDSRNPFQSLSDKKQELAEAEQELAQAQIELESARQAAEAVKGGAKIENGITSSKLNSKTGKIESTKSYLTEAQALDKVKNKTNEYNKAKDKVVKTDAKVIKAEKDVFEIVEDLNYSIKELGDTIGGPAGEIISFIGDIGTFALTTMNSIDTVSTKTVTAMQAVEKASVILGIISAAIQLMQKLESILPTADSQYEKYAAKLEEINKLTDAINEYKIAALEAQHAEEGWFSEDNLKNLRNYKELHDQVTEAYKEKASESQAIYQNKSGGGWFTNSWNWILDNTYGKIYGVDFARKYEEGQTAAIDNLRIETRKRKKGILGSGIGGKSQKTEDLVSWARNNGFGDLFDEKGMINKESANSILNQYGDKLVGQTKETLESLVKLREKYDEYIQQLHEYTSTLYEPLVDNFVDGIWDWLDSGKNALDSFKEYASDTFRDIVSDMIKTIALEKIFNNEDVWGKGESYQSKVSKVYEDYASGLIDEVELNKRVSELTQKMLSNAEAQLPAIQGVGENILDTIYKTTGIDLKKSETSSQSSTKKGFEAMSQDTGNELNGRFTALQITGEEIKNQTIIQTGIQQEIAQKIEFLYNFNYATSTEMRDMMWNILDSITDIKKDTAHLYFIRESLNKIENNTKGLSSK